MPAWPMACEHVCAHVLMFAFFGFDLVNTVLKSLNQKSQPHVDFVLYLYFPFKKGHYFFQRFIQVRVTNIQSLTCTWPLTALPEI